MSLFFLEKKLIRKNLAKGFTLIELLIVLAIISILIFLSFPVFRGFQRESELVDSSEKIINILRLAQSNALSSKGSSQWGVFFSTSTEPNQLILFKGEEYNERDQDFDLIYRLGDTIEIYQIALAEEGNQEVIFYQITGLTDQFGELSIRMKNDFEKNITIYLQPFGYSGNLEFPISSDLERIKDSRRVYFEYSRPIDIFLESIILTFDQSLIEEIIINENMRAGQIYWQGEVSLDGHNQSIKIQTHRLNETDTLFSITRDRRDNNKSLTVEISGDLSGSLIEYSEDGLTTNKTSIYATEPEWQ